MFNIKKLTDYPIGVICQLIMERVPTFEPAALKAEEPCSQSLGMTGFFNIYSQRTTILIRLWRLYFLCFWEVSNESTRWSSVNTFI